MRTEFIPTLSDNLPPNDTDHELFALPARLGGLGLCNPAMCCESECTVSRMVSEPLVKFIVTQVEYPYQRHQQAAQTAENLKPSLEEER